MTKQHWSRTAFGRLSLHDAITGLSIAYWLFVLSYAVTYGLPRPKYTILFVGGSLIIYALNQIDEESDSKLEVGLLAGTIVISVISTGYLFVAFEELYINRPIVTYQYEYVLAVILMFAVFYLAYREFGMGLLVVALSVLVYSRFGPAFPGILSHGGLSVTRILDTSVLDIVGFYGQISQIVAAWVALFLLYAGLLKAYGAFDLLMRAAMRAANLLSSGVAQSAVVASMLVGSINGAQTANAAMTGSFTIPMMEEGGLPGRVAGAIEAVASSGGQVMPPVMGSGAFVMAAILGFTYYEILIAGIIPAVIFYLSVAIAVHFTAMRYTDNLSIEDGGFELESKDRLDFLFDAVKFGLPFAVLIYTLGIAQWTVLTSALVTCLLMIATGNLIPIVRSDFGDVGSLLSSGKETLSQTVEGFRYGAIVAAPIALIIALINAVVDLLNMTGMPGTLSLAIIELAGGVLLLAAVLAMVISLLMGMGMPTVAAYTLVAILIAPTFTGEFNIPTLAAHYFVFYAAILSGITPPIAIAVVVTSGIAGANFWKTCFEAVRIGATLFVVPISFLYHPELVVGGLTPNSIVSGAIVLVGGLAVVYGLNFVEAPNSTRTVSWSIRAAYTGAGLVAMVHPLRFVQLGALVVGAVTFAAHRSVTTGQVKAAFSRVSTGLRRSN